MPAAKSPGWYLFPRVTQGDWPSDCLENEKEVQVWEGTCSTLVPERQAGQDQQAKGTFTEDGRGSGLGG